MTQSIPLGPATSITQNVVYALPSRACIIASDAAVDVSQSIGGPFTAYTAGLVTAGSFVRCISGNTVITCKA